MDAEDQRSTCGEGASVTGGPMMDDDTKGKYGDILVAHGVRLVVSDRKFVSPGRRNHQLRERMKFQDELEMQFPNAD